MATPLLFSIVDFPDSKDTAIVQYSWIQNETCFWPPASAKIDARSISKKTITPGRDWKKYRCTILRTFDSYDAASKKLRKILDDRTTTTESEDLGVGKRKISLPSKLLHSDNLVTGKRSKKPLPETAKGGQGAAKISATKDSRPLRTFESSTESDSQWSSSEKSSYDAGTSKPVANSSRPSSSLKKSEFNVPSPPSVPSENGDLGHEEGGEVNSCEDPKNDVESNSEEDRQYDDVNNNDEVPVSNDDEDNNKKDPENGEVENTPVQEKKRASTMNKSIGSNRQLSRIALLLEEEVRDRKVLHQLVRDLSNKVSSSTCASPLANEDKEELPLKTIRQIKEFDRKLNNRSFFEGMRQHLVSLGGNDMPNHMRRMLCASISDEVSLKFTFYGYGPSPKRPVAKIALRKTRLMECIFDASKHFDSGPSMKKREISVRYWLKHAVDRIKSAKERRNNDPWLEEEQSEGSE